ncbi:hypothetical protein [Natronorarus salvus]|uniref:hypothetical protein n=1 Tax=Natronorarus salvus TaxID=3117733 RepID=UPI002F2661CA
MTRFGRTLLGSLALLLAFPGTAVAQGGQPPTGDPMADPVLNLFVTALGTLLYMGLVFVVGGIAVLAVPDFVRGVDREIRDSPVLCGLVGVGLFVGLIVALFVLAITVVGLLLAVPGAIALFVAGLLSEAMIAVSVGFVLAGVLDREGVSLGWAFVGGLLAVTLLSLIPLVGFLTLFLTAVGFGGLSIHLWNRFQADDEPEEPEPEEPGDGAWTASDHVDDDRDDYSRS